MRNHSSRKGGIEIDEFIGGLLALLVLAGVIYIWVTGGFNPSQRAVNEVIGCTGTAKILGTGECITPVECEGRSNEGWSESSILNCPSKNVCCVLPNANRAQYFRPGSLYIVINGENHMFIATKDLIPGQTLRAVPIPAEATFSLYYIPESKTALDPTAPSGKKTVTETNCKLTIGKFSQPWDNCYDRAQDEGGLNAVAFYSGNEATFKGLVGGAGTYALKLETTTNDAATPGRSNDYPNGLSIP